MIRPPGFRSSTFTLRAAGFIAISTSGASPAVSIEEEPKLIWKAETPKVVPCGARISAGKSGKVARSLPASAVDRVNWPPVSCMPSPLSPAKRTTTASGGAADAASSGVSKCVAVAKFESFSAPFTLTNGAGAERQSASRPVPACAGRGLVLVARRAGLGTALRALGRAAPLRLGVADALRRKAAHSRFADLADLLFLGRLGLRSE